MAILADVLSVHHSVRSLGIRGCNVDQELLVKLALSIKHFGLISIQMAAVKMTYRGAAAFATGIQESSVKRLDVSQNEIGTPGCQAIADALKDCGLESLIMPKNLIGPNGIIYLARVLKSVPTTLKVLDVSRNDIGDQGAEALAWAMPFTNLTCLLVDTNGLTLRGYKAICEAVIRSPKMVEIVLSGNPMRGEMVFMIEVTNMLQRSKLEYLSLNICAIDPPLLLKLAEGVRDSLTIEHLELKGNLRLTDESMDEFLRMIGPHRALRKIELDLSGVTFFKQADVQFRLRILHSNRSLALQALISAKELPYIGNKARIKVLPRDLIRRLGDYLPEDGSSPVASLPPPPGQEQEAAAGIAAVPQAPQPVVHYQPQPVGITVTQHLSVIPPRRQG